MKRNQKRIVGLVLSLAFVLNLFASPISAADLNVNDNKIANKLAEYTFENIPNGLMKHLSEGETSKKTKPASLSKESADDLTSMTVVNEDGSKTLYRYQEDIKYLDKQGKIKFKDNAIVKSSKMRSLFDQYSYENAQNDVKTYFPNKIDNGIKLEYNNSIVQMSPKSQKKATKEGDASIVTGSDEEQYIEYQGAFGDDTALQYMPVSSGVKENIILNKYTGQNEFEFTIDLGNLKPAQLEGVTIPLINPDTGKSEIEIGQIDAKDSFKGDENFTFHATFDNSLSLTPIDDKGKYILKVIVNKEFLEDATTVYPVTIDPSIDRTNIYSTTVLSNGSNIVSGWNTIGKSSPTSIAYNYTKTNAMGNYKYINPENITSAYYRYFEGSGRVFGVNIYTYSTWFTTPVDQVTYAMCNDCVANPGAYVSTTQLYNSNQYYNFDIKELVVGWLEYEIYQNPQQAFNQQAYGFVMAADGGVVNYKQFYSNLNATNSPSIVINYNEDTSLDEGYYFIKSSFENKYLDVQNGTNAPCTNVQVYPLNATASQQWHVTKNGDGTYTIASMLNENLVLDVNYYTTPFPDALIYTKYTATTQKWRLVQNTDGTYRIMNGSRENDGLDVYNLQSDAVSSDFYNGPYQSWTFERINEVFYKINDLHQLARNYDSNVTSSNKLILQFMRSGRYYSGNWPEIAGAIDQSFISYVNQNNSNLDFLKTPFTINDSNYGEVDFTHLAATANGILYDSTSFGTIIMGESTVNALSGWAGDLQSLEIEAINATNNSSDYTTFYNAVYSRLGSENSTFSMPDLLADLDATYLAPHMSSELFGIQLINYYSVTYQNRFSNFIDSRSKYELKLDVQYYTYNSWTAFYQNWPLFDGHTVTTTQAEATADAFIDYIWERQ